MLLTADSTGLHTFEVVLPREVVATTVDGTFELSGVLSPESTGPEGVVGGNLGLWVLAEDLPDVAFLDRAAGAGQMNPVFTHRIRATLAPSKIEVERSLCRESTWNRVRGWMLKGGVAVMAISICGTRPVANSYTALGPSFPKESTWKCGSGQRLSAISVP